METRIMARPSIYRILEYPWVYNLAQRVLAPGQSRLDRRFFRYMYTQPAALILDVGCGPSLTSPSGNGRIVDTDVDVIHSTTTPRTRFGFACSAARLPFRDETFDEVRCRRLFHHLTQEQVTDTIREMARCTRPGGRIVLMDVVLPVRAWCRPVAWLMCQLDRGEWVRSEEELRQLVDAAYPGDWSLLRYTCNYLGAEALALIQVKGEDRKSGSSKEIAVGSQFPPPVQSAREGSRSVAGASG
jgi:SAM-dependent methyltransferase